MRDSSWAVRQDGSSALEASLAETLTAIGRHEIADLLLVGTTADELVRVVATTPPFSSALAGRIQRHLQTRKG